MIGVIDINDIISEIRQRLLESDLSPHALRTILEILNEFEDKQKT